MDLPVRVLQRLVGALRSAGRWFWTFLYQEIFSNPYVVFAAGYAFLRALGVTVNSGSTGQRFTLGRTDKRLDPGFHWLIPFVQRAKVVPTRARTMELEAQRVVTRDGLVVLVSTNLVWRIVDLRLALVEVDHLLLAMRDWLAVAAARVVSSASRADLDRKVEGEDVGELDRRLERELGVLLSPWGVLVERAGFPTIAPNPRTAALLQTRPRVLTRLAAFEQLGATRLSLCLSGGAPRLLARVQVGSRLREQAARAARRTQVAARRSAERQPIQRVGRSDRPKKSAPRSDRFDE